MNLRKLGRIQSILGELGPKIEEEIFECFWVGDEAVRQQWTQSDPNKLWLGRRAISAPNQTPNKLKAGAIN